jgi:hypothetical protein
MMILLLVGLLTYGGLVLLVGCLFPKTSWRS